MTVQQMDNYRFYIHKSRYARYLDEKQRRENWDETVQRLIDFYVSKFPDHIEILTTEIKTNILKMEVMPSMRSMMTAGPALERDNISGFNCAYIAVDNIKAFSESLFILMNGCFDPNTMIKTKTGDIKISELTIKHEVLSFNIKAEQFEYLHPLCVMPTPHSAGKDKIQLEFEDGTIIKCTSDHEFYTTNRGWVAANKLNEEDNVKNYHEI
jgi:hypothetical protein